MISSIVLGYDGSSSANIAFDAACDLAITHKADLLVLSVYRPPEPGNEVETEADIENAEVRYATLFEPLKQQVKSKGISARFEVAVGHPANLLAIRAEEEGANLIVVGHRGTSLLKRLLVGSVAKHVIDLAHCPVLVVR